MAKFKFFDGINSERIIEADAYEVDALTGTMVQCVFVGAPYVRKIKNPMTGSDVELDGREKLASFCLGDRWRVERIMEEDNIIDEALRVAREA